MDIEQIKGELDLLEGHLLQSAINNTDGTVKEIKSYLYAVSDEAWENECPTLADLVDEALETLQYEIGYLKPFQ